MKYFLAFSLILLSLVFFSGFENAEAIIYGHPLEFWDISDVILDGTVINQFNETDGLVQHDIRVEKYFKNPKPQQMITVYGPGIHSEDWFYPKVFEKGERVLLYLKKVDDKHIILEQSRAATEQCDPRSMIGLSTLPGEGFARGGPTLYFDPYQTCNGYLTTPGFLRGYSPLKQIQAGIKFGDFGCNRDLQPMFKHDNQPVCVKQSSILRLLDYGWTLIDRKVELELRTPLPTIQIVELPKQIESGNPVDFSIEILDIKENHERPTITITNENGETVWSGQHQIPDTSSGMTYDVQYRVLYHMKHYSEEINLEPGTYMVSVSLPSQTITKKIKVESNDVSLLGRFKDMPEVQAFYARYDDVDDYVMHDRVNYAAESEGDFRVRLSLYFDKNFEMTHMDLLCYVGNNPVYDVAQEDILHYLENYHCMTYDTSNLKPSTRIEIGFGNVTEKKLLPVMTSEITTNAKNLNEIIVWNFELIGHDGSNRGKAWEAVPREQRISYEITDGLGQDAVDKNRMPEYVDIPADLHIYRMDCGPFHTVEGESAHPVAFAINKGTSTIIAKNTDKAIFPNSNGEYSFEFASIFETTVKLPEGAKIISQESKNCKLTQTIEEDPEGKYKDGYYTKMVFRLE